MTKSEVWLKCLKVAAISCVTENSNSTFLAEKANALVEKFEAEFGDIYEPEYKNSEKFERAT